MKVKFEFSSYVVLLGGSMIFGLMGRSIEMGLAIVAGAISLSLLNIDKFRKIKGAGFEAELREQIVAVVEKETEPFNSADEPPALKEQSHALDTHVISQNVRDVIEALQSIEYTWRYMGGIMQDTGLSEIEVSDALKWLISEGYARKSIGKQGSIWSLTEKGRYLGMAITRDIVSA